ncbi:MAG: ATP-grasp domain-containing protein [Phycisphaeraceae bacterium]
MSSSRGNLIIIGASARAAAQSALRAGYVPWCIDLFADRDLQAIAPVKKCPRELWPQGVLDLLKDAPDGPVLFTGAMENHPEAVEAIAAARPLLTGPPGAMKKLRDPLASKCALAAAWGRAEGSATPPHGAREGDAWPRECETMVAVSRLRRFAWKLGLGRPDGTMLVKPRQGSGIRKWRPGEPVDFDKEYLQQFIPGRPISAVFHAWEEGTALFGISEQLVGDPSFGAGPFQYAGSIAPYEDTHQIWNAMNLLGTALAAWSEYRGLFGVDAIHALRRHGHFPSSDRTVFPVEVNPRYTASIETLEQAAGQSSLTFFARRDIAGPPPVFGGLFHGKAIIHAKARSEVKAMDLQSIADVPSVGEVIERGQPICTVFTTGRTRDECLTRLRDLAAQVYTRLKLL